VRADRAEEASARSERRGRRHPLLVAVPPLGAAMLLLESAIDGWY
jgi:hypothetical protein